MDNKEYGFNAKSKKELREAIKKHLELKFNKMLDKEKEKLGVI